MKFISQIFNERADINMGQRVIFGILVLQVKLQGKSKTQEARVMG